MEPAVPFKNVNPPKWTGISSAKHFYFLFFVHGKTTSVITIKRTTGVAQEKCAQSGPLANRHVLSNYSMQQRDSRKRVEAWTVPNGFWYAVEWMGSKANTAVRICIKLSVTICRRVTRKTTRKPPRPKSAWNLDWVYKKEGQSFPVRMDRGVRFKITFACVLISPVRQGVCRAL